MQDLVGLGGLSPGQPSPKRVKVTRPRQSRELINPAGPMLFQFDECGAGRVQAEVGGDANRELLPCRDTAEAARATSPGSYAHMRDRWGYRRGYIASPLVRRRTPEKWAGFAQMRAVAPEVKGPLEKGLAALGLSLQIP